MTQTSTYQLGRVFNLLSSDVMFFSYIQAGAGNDATQTIVIVAAPWTLGWSNSPRARPQIMKDKSGVGVALWDNMRKLDWQVTKARRDPESLPWKPRLLRLAWSCWPWLCGKSVVDSQLRLTFDETLLIATVPPFKHSHHTASSCRANVGLTMCSIVGYSHATVIMHNYAVLNWVSYMMEFLGAAWKATILVLGDWLKFETL